MSTDTTYTNYDKDAKHLGKSLSVKLISCNSWYLFEIHYNF